MEKCLSIEECFFGSVTLGERGQVVIPAEARKELNIQPGDKLLVFRHPFDKSMLMLGKVSELQKFFQEKAHEFAQAESHISKLNEEEEERL